MVAERSNSEDDHLPSGELYLVWFSTTDLNRFVDFRLGELRALGDMMGLGEDIVVKGPPEFRLGCAHSLEGDPAGYDCPYAWIMLPGERAAQRIASRSSCIWRIVHVWAYATCFDNLLLELQERVETVIKPYLGPNISFSFRTRVFGRTMTEPEILEHYKQLAVIPFEGKVKLRRPDHKFSLLFYYGLREGSAVNEFRDLKACFMGRQVARTDFHVVVNRFKLPDRVYLGPTSTDAMLSTLMANQVHAQPSMLIYDPFVGTGSLLISCASFGAHVLGADLDFKILHGKEGKTMFDNFEQYGLVRPDIMRCDASCPPIHPDTRFDAIISDPPYGVRAGARKTGTKSPAKPVPPEFWDDYISRTQPYEVDEVMNDLLEFAARHLVSGGRLCYLLPALRTTTQDEFPRHARLKFVRSSMQYMQKDTARFAITMRRI